MKEIKEKEEVLKEVLKDGFVLVMRDTEDVFILREVLVEDEVLKEIVYPLEAGSALFYTLNQIRNHALEDEKGKSIAFTYVRDDEGKITRAEVGYVDGGKFYTAFKIDKKGESIFVRGYDITRLRETIELYREVKEEATEEAIVLKKFLKKWTYFYHCIPGKAINISLHERVLKAKKLPTLQKGVSVAPAKKDLIKFLRELKSRLYEAVKKTTSRIDRELREIVGTPPQKYIVSLYYAVNEEEIEQTKTQIIARVAELVGKLKAKLVEISSLDLDREEKQKALNTLLRSDVFHEAESIVLSFRGRLNISELSNLVFQIKHESDFLTNQLKKDRSVQNLLRRLLNKKQITLKDLRKVVESPFPQADYASEETLYLLETFLTSFVKDSFLSREETEEAIRLVKRLPLLDEESKGKAVTILMQKLQKKTTKITIV